MDVNLVAAVSRRHIDDLAAELAPHFHADPNGMSSALEFGRSFNIFYLPALFKFDILPLQDDAYSRAQFARRVHKRFTFGTENVDLPVASAEDILLSKLAWYRAAGERCSGNRRRPGRAAGYSVLTEMGAISQSGGPFGTRLASREIGRRCIIKAR